MTNQKREKILFWIENHTIHFAISKSLSELYECDMYAMIACSPKQKKFFDEQKFVDYKQKWYLRDNIDITKKPNIENLISLEKKYSISLRKIIYGDRIFFKYNKYHTFSDDEILSIIEQELEFYEKVLDELNPDYVVMRAPEFQDIELFHELCKTKNIPLLVLSSLKLGQLYTISTEPYPLLNFTETDDIPIKDFSELEEDVKLFSKTFHSILKKNQPSLSQKIHALRLLFSTFNSANINSYRDIGRTPFRTFCKTFTMLVKGYFRKSYLDKSALSSVPKNQRYAYFPLHVEPDVALLRIGDFYSEQLGIIKNISQSLPVDMDLIVKEHPAMRALGWRKFEFYKEIQNMPKVQLTHPFASKDDLIKNSSLVITIAGTTALEAAVFQKPSVVFADVNCSSLSCILKVKNLEDLPSIIQTCLDTKVNLKELNYFFNQLQKSTFSCDIGSLSSISNNLIGIGGFLNINEISESKMKHFLDITKDEFALIAHEHIKKLKKKEIS